MTQKLMFGMAALGLLGGMAAAQAKPAEPVKAADAAKAGKKVDVERKIVRWPGGWMYLDTPGVIYHDGSPKPGAANVIMDSGNGVGNKIVLDTGDGPGVTVIRNVRNGVGNTLTVTPKGPVIELPPEPKAPAKK